jgi:hypothetical protein
MTSFHRQVDGWLMKLGAPVRKFVGWLMQQIVAHK